MFKRTAIVAGVMAASLSVAGVAQASTLSTVSGTNADSCLSSKKSRGAFEITNLPGQSFKVLGKLTVFTSTSCSKVVMGGSTSAYQGIWGAGYLNSGKQIRVKIKNLNGGGTYSNIGTGTVYSTVMATELGKVYFSVQDPTSGAYYGMGCGFNTTCPPSTLVL